MTSVIVTFSDGSRWQIPGEFIAEQRAKEIVATDPTEKVEDHVEAALWGDPWDLAEYAQREMTWGEVAEHATRLVDNPANYAEEWAGAEMDVVGDIDDDEEDLGLRNEEEEMGLEFMEIESEEDDEG